MRMRRGVLQLNPQPVRDAVLEALVANHQRFLAFLERRVGSRDTAEDILQDGFARARERVETVRTEESAVAWFYRLLRNALVDHYRSNATVYRDFAPPAPHPDPPQRAAELPISVSAPTRAPIK